MVLVDKLFGRLSSFSFQLKCSSIIFEFDLPLIVRKEPLITGSVILLISQSIDSMQFFFSMDVTSLRRRRRRRCFYLVRVTPTVTKTDILRGPDKKKKDIYIYIYIYI